MLEETMWPSLTINAFEWPAFGAVDMATQEPTYHMNAEFANPRLNKIKIS